LSADLVEAPALVFIGFMGAGKTTGARAAAAALGLRAIDTDRELEQRLGTSIEDYFASHGERAFREVEEDVVAEVLESPPAPVISIGGGAIGSARVRELLAKHTVVMLDVDEPTAWRRAGGKRRPLARDRERFAALHAERAPVYEALADAVLLDGGAETVRRAAGALRRIPAGAKVLWAVAGELNYPVYVGDVLDGTFWPVRGRRFLLSDSSVDQLYGDQIPEVSGRFAMPPGESAKTLSTAETLLRGLASAGMDHDDHVVALGGGVVGDVAGFCAAVYQRGVGVVQVPTTLVAQVDSAYGGKTGVDLPEGKNYVGAYHQPRAVLADPRTLATLPREELAAGMAEVIKTALIAGGPLWARVRRGDGVVDRDLVLACARTKLAVVARDERDAGRRQVLNLGHTVGHAIETATGYARYRHGEAVGLGLLAALTLSGQPDLRGEVADLLSGHGLPITLDPDVDHDAVLAAVQRDKKRRGGRVGFVLVEAPGDVRTGAPVAEADVRAAVAGLR
jgi:shikimate kinase/3-dehydroquinate synthase